VLIDATLGKRRKSKIDATVWQLLPAFDDSSQLHKLWVRVSAKGKRKRSRNAGRFQVVIVGEWMSMKKRANCHREISELRGVLCAAQSATLSWTETSM
jgi:hypothetical protein